MGLLSFNPDTRRIWMFPRNIRDIKPWKLYRILKVLMQCEEVDQYSGEEQKMMYKLLEASGIKKPGDTRDRNPGGMRTYFSQLETLGLIFRVEGSNAFNYTIAGETMANEDNPLQVLQYQLLRHQYPSAYGMGRNVKIDPRMKVKPFMFILRLLHDERLQCSLSNFDVVFPVIYGHNDDCYEYVVQKILDYRTNGSFEETITNWELDLFTPRGDSSKAINNVKDIANTALNYLKAASLIVEDEKVSGHKVYVFNENYEDLYCGFLPESESYIRMKDSDDYVSFQRNYGRYLKSKDTRSSTDTVQKKESPAIQFATFKYVEYLNEHLYSDDTASFVAEMAQYGIKQSEAIKAVEKFQDKKGNLQDNTYLEYACSGGKQSNEFEMATTELLKSMGFVDSKWIGRRKSFKNWRGNFPDVFIKCPGTNECGLADAKASSAYSLGHDDMLKMRETYIHTNEELEPGSKLKYFLYIAGGYRGDVSKSLLMLHEKTNIPVTALDAKGMLQIKSKGWSAHEIESRLFLASKYISSDEIELM